MSGTRDQLRRVEALIQVGMRLARTARSGRVLLARIADGIDLEWIPRPWGDAIVAELEAAQADAREPLGGREVERLLREAWGTAPTRELDEFDPAPVAVTPTSQVHRGVLDGEPVAVKLLRPGLAASARQDLTLLEGLTAPLAAAFPALDPGAVLREFRERVLDELDLEHEAATQRRFHRALRGHPFLTVPAPITRLSHESVLVSEWVDGVPIADAADRDRAAARLVVFVLGAGRAGLVHGEPALDNVLVLSDGRLAILDFGVTRTVSPERVAGATALVDAFIDDDADRLGVALEQLGWLPASHGGDALALARAVLGDLGGANPTRLDGEAVLAARERLFDHPRELMSLLTAGSLPPEDMWPLRGASQLFATIARVGATGSWRELVRAAVHDGWETRA